MAATFIKISSAMTVMLGRKIRRFKGMQGCTRFLSDIKPDAPDGTQMQWYSPCAVDGGLMDGDSTAVGDTIPGPSDDLMQSLSAEEQKTLQILWMEVEMFRQSGFEVPKMVRDAEWVEMMQLKTYMQRRKYCRFIMIKEIRKGNTKKRQEEQKRLRDEEKREDELRVTPDGVIEYGLNRNTIFHRMHDSTMNITYNQWACNAILFGQNLVIDMDFDEYMRNTDCQNCAEQIQMGYGYNKMNRQQFYLHLCNANPTGRTMQCMERCIPNLHTATCLINVTPKSYLELFPKERIVYLTPHCNQVLQNYDHEDVYVVGGFVDKSVQKPLSLAKAKKEGLRIAKLPLDDYLLWGEAGKSLTIDQMMKIMLDVKNTGSWEVALKNVPRRKIKKVNEFEMQRLLDMRANRRKPRWSIIDESDNSRHIPTAKFLK